MVGKRSPGWGSAGEVHILKGGKRRMVVKRSPGWGSGREVKISKDESRACGEKEPRMKIRRRETHVPKAKRE